MNIMTNDLYIMYMNKQEDKRIIILIYVYIHEGWVLSHGNYFFSLLVFFFPSIKNSSNSSSNIRGL